MCSFVLSNVCQMGVLLACFEPNTRQQLPDSLPVVETWLKITQSGFQRLVNTLSGSNISLGWWRKVAVFIMHHLNRHLSSKEQKAKDTWVTRTSRCHRQAFNVQYACASLRNTTLPRHSTSNKYMISRLRTNKCIPAR